MKNHIVLCGRRGVGKTTMIESLMKELTVPVYGYQTRIMKETEGFHNIYIYPAGQVDGKTEPSNHIGDCDTQKRVIYKEVFDGLGADLLENARADGVTVMDEIGFMEIGAERFCGAMLKAFDSDLPILASIKAGDLGAEFLDQIRKHPKTELFMLTRENYDEIYNEILPVIRGWNR